MAVPAMKQSTQSSVCVCVFLCAGDSKCCELHQTADLGHSPTVQCGFITNIVAQLPNFDSQMIPRPTLVEAPGS